MKLQRYLALGACALIVHTGYADLSSSLGDLRVALDNLRNALSSGQTPPPPGGSQQPIVSQPVTPLQTTGQSSGTPPPPPPPPPMMTSGTLPSVPSTSGTQPSAPSGLLGQIQQGTKLKPVTPGTGQPSSPQPVSTGGPSVSSKSSTAPVKPTGMTPQDILDQQKKILAKKQPQPSLTASQSGPQGQPQTNKPQLMQTGQTQVKGVQINAPEIPTQLGVKLQGYAARVKGELPNYTIDQKTGKIGPTITLQHRKNAENILGELKKYVQKEGASISSQDVKSLVTLLERIVYVDPLLINQVHAVMNAVGITRTELYDFIIKLYDLRVRYVEHEFKQIEERAKITNVWQVQKGTADDLDEGLEFAFSLEGLTQEARLSKTNDGGLFADKVEALRQRLLDLLMTIPQKHWDELAKQGLPIAEYVMMLKTPKQAFCVVNEGKGEVFYPFAVDLAELSRQIDAYNKPLTKKSIKAFMLESIIKKLQGFYKYTHTQGSQQVCSTCLNYEHNLLTYMQRELKQGKSAAMIIEQIKKPEFKSKVRSEQLVKPIFEKDGSLKEKVSLEVTDVVNYDDVLTKISNFLTTLNTTLKRDDIVVVIQSVIPHIREVIKSGNCQ